MISKISVFYFCLLLVTAGAFYWSLSAGAVPVSLFDLVQGNASSLQQSVIEQLRLPRAIAAFSVGALLAIAGTLMQVLLRNPLAEPYVLGISGGSAVGALSAIVLGSSGVLISMGAFGGALVSMLLVFALSARGSDWSSNRLLLTGVVLASGWSAIISMLLLSGSEQSMKGMLFWLMGDLSNVKSPAWSIPVVLLALAAGLLMAPSLDLLARGDAQAAALGVETGRLRIVCYIAASMVTGCAVTLGGTIGFVGLIVPHTIRLFVGASHRALIPASCLAGGAFLLIADTLSRTIVAPTQLPVGVVTAVIGVPIFLYLLNLRAHMVR